MVTSSQACTCDEVFQLFAAFSRRGISEGGSFFPKTYCASCVFHYSCATPIAPAEQVHGFGMFVAFGIAQYAARVFMVFFFDHVFCASYGMFVCLLWVVIIRESKETSPQAVHVFLCGIYCRGMRQKLLDFLWQSLLFRAKLSIFICLLP